MTRFVKNANYLSPLNIGNRLTFVEHLMHFGYLGLVLHVRRMREDVLFVDESIMMLNPPFNSRNSVHRTALKQDVPTNKKPKKSQYWHVVGDISVLGKTELIFLN